MIYKSTEKTPTIFAIKPIRKCAQIIKFKCIIAMLKLF